MSVRYAPAGSPPFYFGAQPASEYSEAFGAASYGRGDARVLMMDDSFGVAVVEEEVCFQDPIDFLMRRRARHLDLLEADCPLATALVSDQTHGEARGLVDILPTRFPYVMSLHWVDRTRTAISDVELRCLADPSTLGISDDPLDTVNETRVDNARRALGQCTPSSGAVDVIRHGEDAYMVSWANVILVTESGGETEYAQLVGIEARLQHLWYRLHLYAKGIEGLVDRLDVVDLGLVRKEILRTKLQFAQFCKLDATGSTHLNDLRESLIRTSKLRELYEEFDRSTGLIDELEALR